MDGDEQQRLLEVAGDDGGALVAAGEQGRTGVHDEAALGDAFGRGVALEAVLAQQGKHLAAEIRRGPDDK